MSRPLPALLLFLSLSFAIVSLATDVRLPSELDVTISDEQRTVESDAEVREIDTLEGTIDTISCVFSAGITEIDFLGNTCSDSAAFFASQDGPLNVIATITGGLGDFVTLLGSLMTFNVPGAPTWVRFVIGTPVVGTTAYIVISLVRGAG